MRPTVLPLLAALALGPAVALASDPAPARKTVPEDAPAAWRQKCTACHGRTGDGQTSMGSRMGAQDFTRAEWQRSRTDAQIKQVILEGSKSNRAMRGYAKSLKEGELDALLTFIRSLDAGGAKKK